MKNTMLNTRAAAMLAAIIGAGTIGSGCEQRTAEDPEHVVCYASSCGVVLADEQAWPGFIALDGANVYWLNASNGGVMKSPLDGGAPTVLDEGDISWGLAVDATHVYWTSNVFVYISAEEERRRTRLMKAPIGGGAPVVIAELDEVRGDPIDIEVDAGNIYWTDEETVMKIPIEGGTRVILADGQSYPEDLEVDADSVYWTNGVRGSVMKVPIEGGTPVVLASEQSHPKHIEVDATSVYWIAQNQHDVTHSVMKMPIEGGTPVVLADKLARIAGLAVDDASVYWTDQDGAVMKMPIEGGDPAVLALRQTDAGSIAVDATSVYWTNSYYGGAVMKMPK
jgi:hypothetical protein